MVERTQPGVSIKPIKLITGQHHFKEVVFDKVELADQQLLGRAGDGWAQVTSELAFERSGPARFMSTYPMLCQVVDAIGRDGETRARNAVGRLAAQIWTLYTLPIAAIECGPQEQRSSAERAISPRHSQHPKRTTQHPKCGWQWHRCWRCAIQEPRACDVVGIQITIDLKQASGTHVHGLTNGVRP